VTPVVKHIAENVRRLREQQGLSQGELARRSGVSKGSISQLEAGNSNPTVETVWALAHALGRPFSDLTVELRRAPVEVMRARDGEWIEGAVISSRLLHRVTDGPVIETYDVRLHPGERRRSSAHPTGLLEQLLLFAGRITVGPESDPVVLHAGDSVLFAADVAHVYEAHEPSAGLLIMHYRFPGS
jgi:transcriptional regulator with XRE-family HTH domain